MPPTFIEDHLKKEPVLQNIIVGSESLYRQIVQKIARLHYGLTINMILVVVLLLICVGLTKASVALYCDNYQQKHFIMYTHGLSLWQRHRGYFLIQSSFMLVLLAVALFSGSVVLLSL